MGGCLELGVVVAQEGGRGWRCLLGGMALLFGDENALKSIVIMVTQL